MFVGTQTTADKQLHYIVKLAQKTIFSGFLTQIYKKLLNSVFQFRLDVHSGVVCADTNIGEIIKFSFSIYA
jgi:hypothetical protein